VTLDGNSSSDEHHAEQNISDEFIADHVRDNARDA
jgi:hypothetical protein